METPGTYPLPEASSFRMIDVGEKPDTQRRAVASGRFYAKECTISIIREGKLPKGDVMKLAEIAGIQGAKLTATILPLCHPLPLTSVRVWVEAREDHIKVSCEAKTIGKTGVEMEALSGVSAALLCLYDLTKNVDPNLEMSHIQLELKEGGKSGRYINPRTTMSQENSPTTASLQGLKAGVVILSDRCSSNQQVDSSGPVIKGWLEARGTTLPEITVIPDDSTALIETLSKMIEKGCDIVVTSGGTGISNRDITPETLSRFCFDSKGKEIPGIGELIRSKGAEHNKRSWLSRSSGYLIKSTLIITLPGSPQGSIQSLDAAEHLIKHGIHTARGGHH